MAPGLALLGLVDIMVWVVLAAAPHRADAPWFAFLAIAIGCPAYLLLYFRVSSLSVTDEGLEFRKFHRHHTQD